VQDRSDATTATIASESPIEGIPKNIIRYGCYCQGPTALPIDKKQAVTRSSFREAVSVTAARQRDMVTSTPAEKAVKQ